MSRLYDNARILAFLSVISLCIFFFSPTVSFSIQWPLYEALRTTAAIIFAVIGAWVAIAFPDRLRKLSGSQVEEEKAPDTRMLDLFEPVFHSTVILCLILIIGIAAPIMRAAISNPVIINSLNRASFALLVFLTLWQVWTVILTLRPADALKSQMARDISDQQAIKALHGHSTAMQPPEDSN